MKNATPDRRIDAVRVRMPMNEQERTIVNVLTPSERLEALLEAGRKKMQALLGETAMERKEVQ